MYQKSLISAILITCLFTMAVGMLGVVATPTPALAEGNGSDPPSNPPAPPDTTYDAVSPTENSQVANRSLKQNLPIDLAVEIMIRAIML